MGQDFVRGVSQSYKEQGFPTAICAFYWTEFVSSSLVKIDVIIATICSPSGLATGSYHFHSRKKWWCQGQSSPKCVDVYLV